MIFNRQNLNLKDFENIAKIFIDDDHRIELNYKSITSKDEEIICELLKDLFFEIGKENISDYIIYIFREILNNAKKANIKRIFFLSENLNIEDDDDYQKGMKNFKQVLLSRFDYYNELLEKSDFYIKIEFYIENDYFFIRIKNNSKITHNELQIVNEKLEHAMNFNNIEDAITVVSTNQEGAGLGLIISALMLKKLKLNINNIKIYSEKNETISYIKIPLSVSTIDDEEYINQKIIDEINDIPQFPENIARILEILNDVNFDNKKLIQLIVHDALLTGKIIKFANSPIYLTHKVCTTISDAIKIIGITGLRNLILSYGSELTLKKKYNTKKVEEVFEHSDKVANLAFSLAKRKLQKNILEELYIAGLLHDLGRIVIESMQANILKIINKICLEKGISLSVIEKISGTLNHTYIGSELAKKWNFPELLVDVLLNHHSPELSKKEYRDICYYIFLANQIIKNNYEPESTFFSLTQGTKIFFNFKTVDDLSNLISSIKK